MVDYYNKPANLYEFPTELLIYIFKFLSAKTLTLCREVCQRWKEVVDHVSNNDVMWEKYCEKDFKTTYLESKEKSNSCRLFFDIYRSLKLWGQISYANEFRDEFCHSQASVDQIQDMYVKKNGEICVHKRGSVVFYDITTLEQTKRGKVHGEYAQFIEYTDFRIILTKQSHLKVYKINTENKLSSSAEKEKFRVFYNIKYFVHFGRYIYFVDIEDVIFHCSVDDDLSTMRYNKNYSDTVISLSVYDNHLHMLSFEGNVYSYRNNEFVKLFNLNSKKDNLLNFLWQYKFLGNFNWRSFYIWSTILRIIIPDGPLKYICTMKAYGDVYFIGCNDGVLLIYYKPYTNGCLDLFNHNPVKQYRFTERYDIPVLSLLPILKVDIIEIKGGHKMLVALPKKVIIVTFIHNFEVIKSKAVVPYVMPGPVVLRI